MRTIDYFDKSAELHPDRTLLIEGEARRTYREVQDDTHRIARAMLAAGLAVQERVAIYSPNSADVLVCLLSLWRARAVWAPVNARNALDANAAYLNYVGATWLFYHSTYADDAAKLRASVPSLRMVVCLDRDDGDNPSLALFTRRGEAADVDQDWGDPFGNLDELVGIFPTGGTTGPAKGVRVTNLGWGTMLETAMNAWRRDGDLVCLATAPLTHAAGPVAMAAIALGASVAILPGFDALAVLQAIERYRVTHLFLPPSALYLLLAHPQVHEFDYSSLEVFLLAGSPVSPQKLSQAVQVFGPCICQSYGQTEAPMLATWLPPDVVAAAAAGQRPERLASCGKATSSVRVGIMDDAGALLPVGEAGEIVVRGALVSHSYHDLPEATADVRTGGWHHTGDVGYRDEHGYVYIVDRKKDMIISGGFNVFSAEVESAVMALPEVAECAVVGAPHAVWGEQVTAIVVLAPGRSASADTIIAYCKVKLGGVKAPKAVYFRDAIPRTPAGKFDKKAIRAEFWSASHRNVN